MQARNQTYDIISEKFGLIFSWGKLVQSDKAMHLIMQTNIK